MAEKYKVMSSGDVYLYKKWAVKKVMEWHDEVRPNNIILTETSAVPFGWLLKSAWKEMYPGEQPPAFYRIAAFPDGKEIHNKFLTDIEGKNSYFSKRHMDSSKSTLVYDETDKDSSGKEERGPKLVVKNGKTNFTNMEEISNNRTLRVTAYALAKSGLNNVWIDSGRPRYSDGKNVKAHVVGEDLVPSFFKEERTR